MYSLGDVHRGYRWLGHRVTEVAVLHPLYRAGDVRWNHKHGAWPITNYITNETGLVDIVRAYAGKRMICYGVNPRPAVLRREDGRLRNARETDISVSQNLLLDIDLVGAVTPARLDSLQNFFVLADEYFASVGVAAPVRALTGRGAHLLFAYQPISVDQVADLRERLRSFKHRFVRALRPDLSRLEARVDSTQDLRRMTRVYGTTKPQVGIVSKFFANGRVEDEALRSYLLGMRVRAEPNAVALPVVIGDGLPEW